MANIELSQEYENLKNEIQELKNTLTETVLNTMNSNTSYART